MHRIVIGFLIMSAWVQVEVDELPEFSNRKRYTTYKLPDGQVWVPNNMFLDGEPTHWMKIEDHLDQLELKLDRDKYR